MIVDRREFVALTAIPGPAGSYPGKPLLRM